MPDVHEEAELFDEVGVLPGTKYKRGDWQSIASHTDTEIKGFFGAYRFLSNFWPCEVYFEGHRYHSVENAYKAAKVLDPVDRAFMRVCSPKEAIKRERALGVDSKVHPHIWNVRKRIVMRELVTQKFSLILNPHLQDLLLATGSVYLEETNWWRDTYWGVYRTNNSDIGEGQNTLGWLLMHTRANLRIWR